MTAHEAIAAMRAKVEGLKKRAEAERVLHPKTILAAKNYLLIKDYDNLLASLDTLETEEKKEDTPDEVVHFAFYRHNDDPQSLYLANVFVKENDRSKGYGNNILTMAEAAARSVGAWCIVLKAKKGSDAMAWYARHGFTEIEEVGGFVWMRKSILEEKEVDLGKDIDAFFDKWDRNSNGCFFDENGAVVTIKTIKGVVKHFLNARKGE